MAPQIHENWSKIKPGAAHGPFILRFWVFWSKVKNTTIFDTAPEAPKIEKNRIQGCPGSRPVPPEGHFWQRGSPRAAPFRARSGDKRKKQETRGRNKKQDTRNIRNERQEREGSNTPVARGLAN